MQAPRAAPSPIQATTVEDLAAKLHTFLKEDDPNYASRSDEQKTAIASSFLGSAVPGFLQTDRVEQQRLAAHVAHLAQQPTVGERVQSGVEHFGPAVATMIAGAVTGGSIPVMSATAFATDMVAELIKPLTAGDTPNLTAGLQQGATDALLVPVGERVLRAGFGAAGRLRTRLVAPRADEPATVGARKTLEPLLTDPATGKPLASLTPAQLSETPPAMVELAENIAENGIFGRGIIRGQRQTIDEAVSTVVAAAKSQLDQGFATNEEVADLFLNHYKGISLLTKALSRKNHEIVDELSNQGVAIPTKGVISKLGKSTDPIHQEIMRAFQVAEIRDAAGNVARRGHQGVPGFLEMVRREVSPAVPGRTSKVLGSDGKPIVTEGQAAVFEDTMSFADADRMRSELMRIARDYRGATASGHDRQVAKAASQMAETIKVEMDKAARALSPQAADAYNAAKAFHRTEVVEKLENELVLSMIDTLQKQPGKLSAFLLRPENIDKINVVKVALSRHGDGSLDPWPVIQGKLLSTIAVKAVREEALGLGLGLDDLARQGFIKEISGKKIMQEFDRLGAEATTALMEGPPGAIMRQMTNAIEVAARRPQGTGKVGTALIQFGALTTVVGAAGGYITSGGDWGATVKGGVAGGTAVLLTPVALAWMFRHPQAMRNVADGMVGGPQSRAWVRLATTMTTMNRDLQESTGQSLREAATRMTGLSLPQSTPSIRQAPRKPVQE